LALANEVFSVLAEAACCVWTLVGAVCLSRAATFSRAVAVC
jgi:hypothetical protein